MRRLQFGTSQFGGKTRKRKREKLYTDKKSKNKLNKLRRELLVKL